MIETRNGNRHRALLMAALLLFTQTGTTVYAGGNQISADGLCEHHTAHIGCSYAAPGGGVSM